MTGVADVNAEERAGLVLTFAKALYVNGEATDQTVASAERLAQVLGLRAKIMPRWGVLQLRHEDHDACVIAEVEADPTGVNMARVASTMQLLEEVDAGRLAPDAALKAVGVISQTPPMPTWLFAFAAGVGAVALAVIFGVQHFVAASLIFVSAAAGAILRRGLARYSENVLIQPFCAA